MLELLLKYKIAKIVTMEESFFHVSILPKNIKLSKEIITLNYEKLAPFTKPTIITYASEKQLYLWFTKVPQLSEKLFVLPEAFLLYTTLKKEGDGMYVFETFPKRVLILKEGRLAASFVTSQEDDYSLDILKNEYQVEESYFYSDDIFREKLSLAIKQLPLKDLFRFLQISLTKKELKNFILEKFTYPFISLLVIYVVVTYLQSYFMQNKIDDLTEQYQELKTKNTVVKTAIRKHNKEIRKYNSFADEELHSVDPYKILYTLYDVITKKDKTVIKSFEVVGNHLRLLLDTKEDAIKYLNRLNKIKFFKNVVIENTYKNRRNGMKTISYTIELRKMK